MYGGNEEVSHLLLTNILERWYSLSAETGIFPEHTPYNILWRYSFIQKKVLQAKEPIFQDVHCLVMLQFEVELYNLSFWIQGWNLRGKDYILLFLISFHSSSSQTSSYKHTQSSGYAPLHAEAQWFCIPTRSLTLASAPLKSGRYPTSKVIARLPTKLNCEVSTALPYSAFPLCH